MAERYAEPGPPTLYQRGGRGAGTVVRDHDFEASVILARQGRQRRIERILAMPEGTKLYLLAPLERKGQEKYETLFDEARKAGYVRVRIDGKSHNVD